MDGYKMANVVWGVIGVGSFGLFLCECYLILIGEVQMGLQETVIAGVCLFFAIGASGELNKR